MAILARLSDFVAKQSFPRSEISYLAGKAAGLGLRYSAGPKSIAIQPRGEEGFPVFFSIEERSCFVSLGGLHQDIQDISQALQIVGGAISGTCRLEIASRGGRACRWTLQKQDNDGAWADVIASGHMRLLDVFRAESVSIKSNIAE